MSSDIAFLVSSPSVIDDALLAIAGTALGPNSRISVGETLTNNITLQTVLPGTATDHVIFAPGEPVLGVVKDFIAFSRDSFASLSAIRQDFSELENNNLPDPAARSPPPKTTSVAGSGMGAAGSGTGVWPQSRPPAQRSTR